MEENETLFVCLVILELVPLNQRRSRIEKTMIFPCQRWRARVRGRYIERGRKGESIKHAFYGETGYALFSP